MTCKDCLHDMACGKVDVFRIAIMHNNKAEKYCENFKNKADFVEVVRCEKCKYSITHTCTITGTKTLFCDYGEKPVVVQPTHFCSCGERKTDNAL